MTELQQKDNKIDEQEEFKADDFKGLYTLKEKLMPWQREIMIVGMIILIALVVFLGFARGGLEVCNDVGGYFDWKLKCHPQLFNWTSGTSTCYDDVGQRFIIPNIDLSTNIT